MKAIAYFCPRKSSLISEGIHDLSRRLSRWAVSIFWRDVLPTVAIFITLGWLTLQLAAGIAQLKHSHPAASAKVVANP